MKMAYPLSASAVWLCGDDDETFMYFLLPPWRMSYYSSADETVPYPAQESNS
jgi:hypothetical protein